MPCTFSRVEGTVLNRDCGGDAITEGRVEEIGALLESTLLNPSEMIVGGYSNCLQLDASLECTFLNNFYLGAYVDLLQTCALLEGMMPNRCDTVRYGDLFQT